MNKYIEVIGWCAYAGGFSGFIFGTLTDSYKGFPLGSPMAGILCGTVGAVIGATAPISIPLLTYMKYAHGKEQN